MAGEVSKEEVGTVLMQAMMAAKNLRPQRDRLLHFQRCLLRLQAGPAAPDEDKLGDLASDLFKVYYIGMEAGARMLSTCLELAVQNGGRYSMNPAFARMPDEQLHDALLAHRLPARPPPSPRPWPASRPRSSPSSCPRSTTSRAASSTSSAPAPRTPAEKHDDTSAPDGKPKTAIDLDKALDFLDSGCTILSLAVAVLSRFLDRKELARLAEFTDRVAYISEDGPYPSTD
ncbi:hypothetical protein CFC21_104840 [Triticum aestivum]|uniref:Uncharacterized protein n=1 Tax=Triticum aestivum TaxID=4565 RepID=A0A9R1MAY7_WHEAT|nr:hypothetical protein CFC21_104840 [Triticum aestivum]